MSKLVIGLTGKLGSGKSEVAQVLKTYFQRNHGLIVEIVPFAKPLKDIARSMGWDGLKDEKGRRLLQLLGTECMRECIDEDGWVHMWERTVNGLPCHVVIADDVRFDNEARAIQKMGGGVVQVRVSLETRLRRGVKLLHGEHLSEAGVSIELLDATFNNDADGEINPQRIRPVLAAFWNGEIDRDVAGYHKTTV